MAQPCPHPGSKRVTNVVQNPLPGFTAVVQTHQLENVRPNTDYFAAARDGTLPAVSWVMPEGWVGANIRRSTSTQGNDG